MAPPAMDSDMEPICGPPLAAGDHRYRDRDRRAIDELRKLMGFLGISDEQVFRPAVAVAAAAATAVAVECGGNGSDTLRAGGWQSVGPGGQSQ